MRQALEMARQSLEKDETPIGCVIVRNGEVIAKGCNLRNTGKSVLCHAEIAAISQACQKIQDWRLDDCTLYVTLEPCPMCAGAIVQARVPRVVIGAMNPKAGCAGSVLDLFHVEGLNHQVEVETGVLADESRELLQYFFRRLRTKKHTSGKKLSPEDAGREP